MKMPCMTPEWTVSHGCPVHMSAAVLIVGVTFVAGLKVVRVADLPRPVIPGRMSLEETLERRRSLRQFKEEPLTLEETSQLCWAGQGITDRQHGFRTSPSAGALYPIELYVLTTDGVVHYLPKEHRLERHLDEDLRGAVQRAAGEQESITQAPACFVITAVLERTARKYGQRAERYCFLEAGHVAQNILLQATALDLGGVPIGSFDDDTVARTLKLPPDHRVLYLLPIGHPPE